VCPGVSASGAAPAYPRLPIIRRAIRRIEAIAGIVSLVSVFDLSFRGAGEMSSEADDGSAHKGTKCKESERIPSWT